MKNLFWLVGKLFAIFANGQQVDVSGEIDDSSQRINNLPNTLVSVGKFSTFPNGQQLPNHWGVSGEH